MSSRGNLQRKCAKGHPKTAGKCSGRCIRYFPTERGTPVNPNHASRAFAHLAASVGLVAHPHLLRHALASAMAANKKPASITATQLRHADGGPLAQRVHIDQLPQTASRLAGVIEGVFGPAARDGRAVSAGRRRREGGGKSRPPSDQSSIPTSSTRC